MRLLPHAGLHHHRGVQQQVTLSPCNPANILPIVLQQRLGVEVCKGLQHTPHVAIGVGLADSAVCSGFSAGLPHGRHDRPHILPRHPLALALEPQHLCHLLCLDETVWGRHVCAYVVEAASAAPDGTSALY